MKLYHLTALENLESIRRHGLNPRIAGQPIYLAADQGHAGAYEAKHLGYEVALLEVNLEVLDPDRLGPDDDDLQAILDQERDPRKWFEVGWQESLERSGQATYDGKIPYSAIRVIAKWKAV